MAFSCESFGRLLERHPLKRRIRRLLLASLGGTGRARFSRASCEELLALCREIQGLDRGLVGTLEERIASPAGRAHLRALWRTVAATNREQLAFARYWLRGGVLDAAEFRRVADSIARERLALRAFARDLRRRARPTPAVTRLGRGASSATRTLTGGTVAVRVNPVTRRGMRLVYKRVARFDSRARAAAYLDLCRRYERVLRDSGLALPWQGYLLLARPGGGWQVILTQERVPSGSIGGEVMTRLSVADGITLTRRIWDEIVKVWRHDEGQPEAGIHVGLDAWITHWAVVGFDPDKPEIRGDERLLFLDTVTPYVLQRGRTLLDHHLMTHGAPSFVAELLDPFVETRLARHHDLRSVLVDYVASCGVAGRADLQPPLVDLANALREGELGRWIRLPLSLDEVRRHQRSDLREARLLRSLHHVGDALDDLRSGRSPRPFETARDLLAILTRPFG